MSFFFFWKIIRQATCTWNIKPYFLWKNYKNKQKECDLIQFCLPLLRVKIIKGTCSNVMKRIIGKQCRPRSDGSKHSIWSGSTLFVLKVWISVKHSTVKPVLVVTSIKQPTCIKQPEKSCPKIHIPIYLNCIEQPPAFSSHILSFPWAAA